MMLYIIYRWTSCIYPEKEHKIPLLVYFAFFRCQCSIGTDFFKLLYTHLEEWECNNVCQNLKQDEEYPEAPQEEIRLCSRFESHALTEEHYFFKDISSIKYVIETVYGASVTLCEMYEEEAMYFCGNEVTLRTEHIYLRIIMNISHLSNVLKICIWIIFFYIEIIFKKL